MPIIKMNNVRKIYPATSALKGINFEIEKGEFTVITGPSGSGKSTLLHIVGLLDIPTSGEYLFDNMDIAAISENQRASARNKKIGFIFQSYEKFTLRKLTVFQNVIVPLIYNTSVPERFWKQMAEEKLDIVGIKDKINDYISQLSGGEAQRVAIARALINNPMILLADEPTGNLDTERSEEIMKLFLELNKRGVTVIIITHNPDIAACAPREIVLKDGWIIRDGAPKR